MAPTSTELHQLRGSYLMAPFETARVHDAMRVGVYTCPPETPLRDVARMMASYHVHCLIVTGLDPEGESEQPWGVVSDLDLVRGAADAGDRTAGGAATTELVTVRTDDTLAHAAELMAEHGVSHLVAVQPGSGRPVGVLSSLDVAGVVAWGEG
jgi:CBS domain-containing protein